jgi:hypothetical protein
MKKNDTLWLVIIGLAGAFILWMFAKKSSVAGEPGGIVSAGVPASIGSSNGILTPVVATGIGEGVNAIESLLDSEGTGSDESSLSGSGDLSELDISDDTYYSDEES